MTAQWSTWTDSGVLTRGQLLILPSDHQKYLPGQSTINFPHHFSLKEDWKTAENAHFFCTTRGGRIRGQGSRGKAIVLLLESLPIPEFVVISHDYNLVALCSICSASSELSSFFSWIFKVFWRVPRAENHYSKKPV